MGYCTIDDLKVSIPEKRLIELTDDNDTGAYNEVLINEIIKKAENEINGYCQERYDVPFVTVPGLIKDFCIELSIYKLYLRRENIPDEIQKNYEKLIKKLRDIADGKISLGTSDVPETNITFSSKTEDDRYFKDPEGYL